MRVEIYQCVDVFLCVLAALYRTVFLSGENGTAVHTQIYFNVLPR